MIIILIIISFATIAFSRHFCFLFFVMIAYVRVRGGYILLPGIWYIIGRELEESYRQQQKKSIFLDIVVTFASTYE